MKNRILKVFDGALQLIISVRLISPFLERLYEKPAEASIPFCLGFCLRCVFLFRETSAIRDDVPGPAGGTVGGRVSQNRNDPQRKEPTPPPAAEGGGCGGVTWPCR